jgi:hypothetical protein
MPRRFSCFCTRRCRVACYYPQLSSPLNRRSSCLPSLSIRPFSNTSCRIAFILWVLTIRVHRNCMYIGSEIDFLAATPTAIVATKSSLELPFLASPKCYVCFLLVLTMRQGRAQSIPPLVNLFTLTRFFERLIFVTLHYDIPRSFTLIMDPGPVCLFLAISCFMLSWSSITRRAHSQCSRDTHHLRLPSSSAMNIPPHG